MPDTAARIEPYRCTGQGTPGTHPLELIPFFRRFPQSIPRDIVYTIIWNSLFALFFGLISIVVDPKTSLAGALRETFVFAQCIGFVIYGGFLIGERIVGSRIHDSRLWVRAAYFSAIPIICIFPGYLLAFRILNWQHGAQWLFSARSVISILALSLILTGIMLLIFLPRERAARAEAAMAREQARVAAAEKEATAARMKLLEAQIEPHFLYNTLAHVVSLVDGQPAVAKRMIERLIVLLRATASAATGVATLRGQIDLLRAYLDILALRMGTRLAWRIDVLEDLHDLRVPPMLLQPVVENAIKHGLEPTVEGGELVVTARREGGQLHLAVVDTGRGIRATSPSGATGLGLPNLRARLAALFGDRAHMTIEDNRPRGTRVTIALPLDALDPAPAGVLVAAAEAR